MTAYSNMSPQLSNFSEYNLAAQVLVADTTITLASVIGLPEIVTPLDYIPMVLRDATTCREVVHVTAVDVGTKVLTVLRAQEGTTARIWPTSSFCYTTMTAEAARDLMANTWRRPTLAAGTLALPTRTGETTFTIPEDQTGMFVADCALRVFQGDILLTDDIYVVSATYDGDTELTTVTVSGTVLAASPALDVVEVSQRPSEIPRRVFVVDEETLRATLGLTVGVDVQAYDVQLDALAALTAAANKFSYFTGASTAALADLTSFGRALIDDVDAATARATLGAQPADDTLTGLAGLTTAADKMIYSTALDTFAMTGLTAYARTLLDDADAATMRATLGLGSGALITSGTAALLNAGVGANNLVQLPSASTLPALNGSALTDLPVQNPTLAQVESALSIVKSLASPGYIKIAGLIIQWGPAGVASGVNNFPITFPTAVGTVVATGVGGAGAYNSLALTAVTTSGFKCQQEGGLSSSYYLAIGW